MVRRPGTKALSVVVADAQPAARMGVRLMLESVGMSVSASAASADQAQEAIERDEPDLIVLEIELAGPASGIELAAGLRADGLQTPILIYTGASDPGVLSAALDCGAQGVALKVGTPDELVSAVRTVAAGGTWIDPRLQPDAGGRERQPEADVSRRERDMLEMLARPLQIRPSRRLSAIPT